MHNKKTSVVHILEPFVGGVRTWVCTVLVRLVENGFDVTLICSLNRSCPDDDAQIRKLRDAGIKVHIVPMTRRINPLEDLRSFVRILRLLKKNHFDIVHTHSSKAGALGRIAAVSAGAGAVFHSPHCFAFLRSNSRLSKSFYFAIERLLAKLTNTLVAVSQSEADIAAEARIVPSQNCVVIPNALPATRIFPKPSSGEKCSAVKASLTINEDARIVTTACRLDEYKGIFRCLQAARHSRTPDPVFLLAGEGKLRTAAQEFIRQNRLAGKVKLLGHVSNMERIYAVTDVVVLCSDAEAQPYLLLEAMRAKCPIVATAVIGNTELISQRRTGLLAHPTPQSIAKAIDELLADKDKSDEYARNAYDYFCKHHTLENQVSKLTETYEYSIQNLLKTGKMTEHINETKTRPQGKIVLLKATAFALQTTAVILAAALAFFSKMPIPITLPVIPLLAAIFVMLPFKSPTPRMLQKLTAFYLVAALLNQSASQNFQIQLGGIDLNVFFSAPILTLCSAGFLLGTMTSTPPPRNSHASSLNRAWLSALLLILAHMMLLGILLKKFYGYGYEQNLNVLGNASLYFLLFIVLFRPLDNLRFRQITGLVLAISSLVTIVMQWRL